MTCDYTVGLVILDDDGTTEILDFNDDTVGLSIETLQMPEDSVREIRASAPRVDGSALLAWAQDDGVLQAVIQCEGSTWGQVTTRWEAARAVYRARTRYLIRADVDGSSVTFRAERPFAVIPSEVASPSLATAMKWQTYVIRWRVQPDPIVTGAP